MIEILKNHKEAIIAIAFLAFLLLVYPSIFSNIYQSGRDLGGALVRALIP